MGSFEDWLHDDITWCSSECDKKECFRNLENRRLKTGYFTMADFKGTEDCPYKDEMGDQDVHS